jgi:tryptophan 7-halogenase
MSSPGPVKHVVIAGGGTAGWMAAAALSKALTPLKMKITLIESDDIGTVGVGEATVPLIHGFNNMLGLNQAEFMAACNATFKLGIQFVDWGAIGTSYFHPFTRYGLDLKNVNFHQVWLKYASMQQDKADAGVLDDYNVGAVAAREHRFIHPISGDRQDSLPLRYAFHFDASLYAQYLRRYSEARGVRRVEGRITSVSQDALSGRVQKLHLDRGETIEGDLFLDCSGFRGLLIEGSLEAGYEDWSHFLPCNRAIAVPCETVEPPVPYTRSTADLAGWRWRIPLQHRVGNGYVYCSDFITDQEAEGRLLNSLDGAPHSQPRRLTFTTGMRRKFWDKNVVAIGLAAGFMEPLESTSIYLIQAAVLRLLALFPDTGFDPAGQDEFNRATRVEYECLRDFLILHYKATRRDDTPFWRYCRDMEIPDRLRHSIELFRSYGRFMITEDQLFAPQSWLSVLMGQGITPQHYDPLADGLSEAEVEQHVRSIREVVAQTVQSMPRHGHYVRDFCASKAVA